MHRYRWRPEGAGTPPLTHVRYWKPIQTGIEQDDDTAEVARLGSCAADDTFERGVRLTHPVSPHLAARLNDTVIDLDATVDLIAEIPRSTRWVVEGAGGVLVPINDVHVMAHVMLRLGMPVVVVARSSLGTINHTLLTIEALRARSIEIAGIVMIGDPNRENRAAIEGYGRVDVLGEMPRFDPLTPEAVGNWAMSNLDPEGLLLEHLC